MRTKEEILESIRSRFYELTGQEFADGTVLDMFSSAVSSVMEEVYKEIDNNKNPHVWSSLSGEKLDDTGYWVGCPRDPNESDISYKYRLMKWVLKNEASNITAINTALLNPKEASNLDFVPKTNGCGTATVYVIPKHYTEDSIKASLKEAVSRMNKVVSPTLHVDYVIPTVRAVSFEVYLKTHGDEASIRQQIAENIRDYVNDIAPKEYLSVGEINKIGVNTDGVEYFSVLSLIVDDEQLNKIRLIQKIDSKFLFDSITWVGDDDDDNV